MELVEANAIELLGMGGKMIVQKDYSKKGFLLYRPNAMECDSLEAHIGRVLVFWVDHREYSYNGEFLVHWA